MHMSVMKSTYNYRHLASVSCLLLWNISPFDATFSKINTPFHAVYFMQNQNSVYAAFFKNQNSILYCFLLGKIIPLQRNQRSDAQFLASATISISFLNQHDFHHFNGQEETYNRLNCSFQTEMQPHIRRNYLSAKSGL
jgi:hypothetical protein